MHFTVIYGSVREKRLGIRAARFIEKQIKARGHDVSFVDAKEIDLPLLDKMYKEYDKGQAPDKLETLAEIYRNTDGFIFVTGEYNHSIPPALKNIIDHFLEEYFWRPSAIVCYSAGRYAGVRAAVHMRAILGEIGTVSIPTLLPVGQIHQTLDKDGEAKEEHLIKSAEKFLDELEWYASALQEKRKSGTP